MSMFSFLKHVRSFHSSSNLNSHVKVMRKILTGGNKKKHRYTETPILPKPSLFSKGTYEGKRSINSRRATVLNKLFMQYITDLMATGECSSAFVGYNIEINRVQVTPDFNQINVYWLAKGTVNDEVIENVLSSNTGLLRHELSQLKVIGVVPKIKFFKDKHLARILELDLCLAKADFGEDYVPTDPSLKLKSQLQLDIKLSPQIKQQIEEINSEIELNEYEEPPVMTNNIFGLDQGQIMDRITKNMSKLNLKKDERNYLTNPTVSNNNENSAMFNNKKDEREALKDFLFKRQLLKTKKSKESNLIVELDNLQEESLENNDELYDGDYIEDEDLK